MGDEPTEELRDAVRGITGQALEIEGTRQVNIVLGRRNYTHRFVVAPFVVKKRYRWARFIKKIRSMHGHSRRGDNPGWPEDQINGPSATEAEGEQA